MLSQSEMPRGGAVAVRGYYGADARQLGELSARVAVVIGDITRSAAIGLYRSVAMVAALMRKNLTPEVAGAIFGVSQPTVFRRRDLLRPLIGAVPGRLRPAPGPDRRDERNAAGRRHRVSCLGLAGDPGPVRRQGRVSRH